MRIVVGGATGFIGTALCQALARRGDEVIVLSRTAAPGRLTWDSLKEDGLLPCDAVVNLAGAGVMAQRWTETYKKILFSSRIDSALLLARAIRESSIPPRTFINASAIAFYPCDERLHFDEDGPAGSDFLSLLVSQWERASELPSTCPTRRVSLRIGAVLGQGGGALAQIVPAFRLGLGGRIGSGKQPFCWIHLTDLVNLILFCLDNRVSGPVNGVSPNPVTMGEFSKELAQVLKRPSWLPIPGWVLKLMLGERATILLNSPWAEPRRALDLGFSFRFPSLKPALKDLVTR